MRKISLTAALVALVVTGCSSGEDEPDTKELSTSPEASASPAGEKEGAPEEPSDGPQAPASLTGKASLGERATVQLSGVQRGTSGPYAAPENTPFVQFTVKVTNTGSSALDPAVLMVSCAYGEGGQVADAVFDTDAGVGEVPTVKILAGKSATWTEGCTLPEGEREIQIQVEDMEGSETALFHGEVK